MTAEGGYGTEVPAGRESRDRGLARRTPSAIYHRKQRAFQTAMAAARKLAAIADPRTSGDQGLVHNWGNQEARDVFERAWRRWDRYSDASRRAYDAAMHAEHEAEGRDGKYLWCDACRRTAASAGQRRTKAE